ncbi:MAG: hypothetical protein Q4D38_11065, partial [Planctomycetia bacterium]|nr:hypothetical protein [Planctomycetia bacterium]
LQNRTKTNFLEPRTKDTAHPVRPGATTASAGRNITGRQALTLLVSLAIKTQPVVPDGRSIVWRSIQRVLHQSSRSRFSDGRQNPSALHPELRFAPFTAPAGKCRI